MASLTLTPASGSITAVDTVVKVLVEDADENTLTGYDADKYPASPEMRYYLTFEKSGVDTKRSYVFSTDSNGDHLFNNFVFDDAGTWTVYLRDAADDSSVTSTSVTVA